MQPKFCRSQPFERGELVKREAVDEIAETHLLKK